MITIRPSTVTDSPPVPPEVAPTTEEHEHRIPLVWIPATLSAGLLIAAIYLGVRIFTAHSHAAPSTRSANVVPARPTLAQPPSQPNVAPHAAVAPTAAPIANQPEVKSEVEPADGSQSKALAQAEAITEPPKPAFKPVGPQQPTMSLDAQDAVPMITPRAGERYIQVGALNPEATRRFVQRLRNEKMEPHVAPGPKPELMRVLIGPFNDRDAITEQKTQLQSHGIDNFVRKY
jgi:cell division septation protein DedD